MTRRQWQAAFSITGLVLVTAWCVQNLAMRSGNPGYYYQYRNSAEGFVYPTDEVVKWSVIIVIELALACLLVARIANVPRACMLVGVIMAALLFSLAIFAMHAPPYFGGFVAYQLLGAIWCVIAALVTGIWSLVRTK